MPVAWLEPSSARGSAKVFHPDTAPGVFGLGNKPLADDVVLVSAEAGFPRRQSFQSFLGPTGALPLSPHPVAVMAAPDLLDGITGMFAAVGITGDVDDPQIDPDEVLDFDRGVFGHVHRGEQVELAAPIDQIDLAFNPVEPLALVFAVGQREVHAAIERPQAHAVESLEAQDAFVVGDGAAAGTPGTPGGPWP